MSDPTQNLALVGPRQRLARHACLRLRRVLRGGLLFWLGSMGPHGIIFANEPAAAPSPPDSVTLSISVPSWMFTEFHLEEETRAWERQNPGVGIRLLKSPDQFETRVMLFHKSGFMPYDALVWAHQIVPGFVAIGAVVPLDSLMGGLAREFVPAFLDMGKVRGQIYFIPFLGEVYVLNYRRDLLKARGISRPPRTWGEFSEFARRLTYERDGVRMFGAAIDLNADARGAQSYVAVRQSWFGNLYRVGSPAPARIDAQSTGSAEVFRLLKRLRDSGHMPETLVTEGSGPFDNGIVAMYINWQSRAKWAMRLYGEEVAVAPLPGRQGTLLGGAGFCITALSNHKALAFRFMTECFLRALEEDYIAEGKLPVLLSSYADTSRTPAWMQALLPQVQRGISRIEEDVTFAGQTRAIYTALQRYLVGAATLDEALWEADVDIDRAIEEASGRSVERSPWGDRLGTAAFFVLLGLALWTLARKTVRAPSRRGRRVGYAFILPAFLLLTAFSFYPLLRALYLSFTDYAYLREGPTSFVWLGNYLALLRDPDVLRTLGNTIYFAALNIPLSILFPLAAALLVFRMNRGATVFRTIYFIPVVVSGAVIAVIWTWIYHNDYGILNHLLAQVLGPGARRNWLGDRLTAMPALVVMTTWHGMGFTMMLFLVGLSTIPRSIYEVARLDGAGAWKQFVKITLPLLRPTLIMVLILSVIGSLRVVVPMLVMTVGGPAGATESYIQHMLRVGFEEGQLRMGYASALAYAIAMAIALISYFNMKLYRSELA